MTGKGLFRLTMTAALAAGTGLLIAPAATAAASPSCTPVNVPATATAAGLNLPPVLDLRPGATTFRISTPESTNHPVGLIQVNDGVTLAQVVADLKGAFSNDPAVATPAGQALTRDAVMHGGALVSSRAPLSFTVTVAPGTYYLFDYRDVYRPDVLSRVHEIRVSGDWGCLFAPADRLVVQYEMPAGQPKFLAPTHLAPHTRLRVFNATPFNNETMLVPVAAGVTDADLDAYYNPPAGQTPVSPFIGGSVGLLPLSSGRSAVLEVDVAPGRYALISFVEHYDTARSNAAMGLHKVVTVG